MIWRANHSADHMEGIASLDLFVVPTIAFQQLFAFLVLGHKRRQLLWFAVTCNPTLPQYQDFGFQPQSRLEEVAQHAGKQEADRNHSAIMF